MKPTINLPYTNRPILETIDDFIQFFKSIPTKHWCVLNFNITKETTRHYIKQCCARGHVGDYSSNDDRLSFLLFGNADLAYLVGMLNNKPQPLFPQRTPRSRILAALLHVKKHGPLSESDITNR